MVPRQAAQDPTPQGHGPRPGNLLATGSSAEAISRHIWVTDRNGKESWYCSASRRRTCASRAGRQLAFGELREGRQVRSPRSGSSPRRSQPHRWRSVPSTLIRLIKARVAGTSKTALAPPARASARGPRPAGQTVETEEKDLDVRELENRHEVPMFLAKRSERFLELRAQIDLNVMSGSVQCLCWPHGIASSAEAAANPIEPESGPYCQGSSSFTEKSPRMRDFSIGNQVHYRKYIEEFLIYS